MNSKFKRPPLVTHIEYFKHFYTIGVFNLFLLSTVCQIRFGIWDKFAETTDTADRDREIIEMNKNYFLLQFYYVIWYIIIGSKELKNHTF